MKDDMGREGLSPAALDLIDAEFPGATSSTYLSSCTRGLLPVSARAAIDGHLDDLGTGRTDKAALFDMIEDVRSRFAAFVGADADEIAFTKNVSDGLNMIAASMDWRAGDNVIVTLSLEHPNNVYPWLNQRERHGVEVRTVPDVAGHVDIEAMIAAIDERTRVVTVPTVSFSPGFRADVARLGAVCRDRDIFLLVDAVQSVGVLTTDVAALGVDGLAVSTQKGLCGLYGMGFLYCRQAWAERLTPAYLARFGVDLGDGAHEASMGSTNYRLMDGARRFDLGNHNFPAAAAVRESLRVLDRIGAQAIEDHVVGLSSALAEGLLARGLPVAGGAPGPHTSSILCVGAMSDAHDGTDDADIQDLYEFLSAEDVIHSIRRGMLRFAFHVYNTEDDVARVLELVDRWQASRAA